MKLNFEKVSPPILYIVLFTFVFSLVFFLVVGRDDVKRTVFFPKATPNDLPESSKLLGEVRFLPRQRTVEQNVRLLVEDLILGPVDMNHSRLLSQQTWVRGVIYERGNLYINLSKDIAEVSYGYIPLEDQIQAIGNTVLFNFPGIRELYILIEGQIPVFPFSSSDFVNGISFSKQHLL